MSLLHLIKYAFTLAPGAALRGGLRLVKRTVYGRFYAVAKSGHCSFLPPTKSPLATPLLLNIENPISRVLSTRLSNVDIFDHCFNLLGSGPIVVCYGMIAKGYEGRNYVVGPGENDPASLVNRLNSGNRVRAQSIRRGISATYHPIDWQLDFKSGFRWSEKEVSKSVRYGHKPGVDIKVPWELSRLQHLPRLALDPGSFSGTKHITEFQDQILDFIAANPPGWGVNWVCSMDVGIRAANMILAFELFRAQKIRFSSAFQNEFTASIRTHGRHIVQNLEWSPLVRGNHYLSNITGLAFIARFLPEDNETNGWLAYVIQELIAENEVQFLNDGANFEGSTSYHKLSSEIIVYATAVMLGLPVERQRTINGVDLGQLNFTPPLTRTPGEWHRNYGPFSRGYFEQLLKSAIFSIAITKPNGSIVQIGDNDSGHFFNFQVDDNSLDHRGLIASISGLIENTVLSEFVTGRLNIEAGVVQSLSGQDAVPMDIPAAAPIVADVANYEMDINQTIDIEIILPDAALTKGLQIYSFQEFGLYIWKSERLFLSVRCGAIGQNGRGGHAHNDQLAIELQVDGEDWVSDPGSFIYTADPAMRDAYRSVNAHTAPRYGEGEPSSLGLGIFRLEDNANAKVLQFSSADFGGVHTAYSSPVQRTIKIKDNKIIVRDAYGDNHTAAPTTVRKTATTGKELRELFGLTLPFSSGYGRRVRD